MRVPGGRRATPCGLPCPTSDGQSAEPSTLPAAQTPGPRPEEKLLNKTTKTPACEHGIKHTMHVATAFPSFEGEGRGLRSRECERRED